MKSRYLALALVAGLAACGTEDDKPTREDPDYTDHNYPTETTYPVSITEAMNCIQYCRGYFAQLCESAELKDGTPLRIDEVIDPKKIKAGDATFTCSDTGEKYVQWEDHRSCNEVCNMDYGKDCVKSLVNHNYVPAPGSGICGFKE